ncbi:MAG: glycosyltransferase [Deltaproteobacteria bacterium]|nr:glycosyltransferase [Deltaproteobacteria bacterium]
MGQATSVRLVLHPALRNGIIEKLAARLAENLPAWGFAADLAEQPSRTAAVNHWLLYYYGPDARVGPATMLVTHIDRPHKLRLLQKRIPFVDVAVCVSRMTLQQLLDFNVPGSKLTYVTPGCDLRPRPRRTVIALSSRVYPDSRKREHLLVRLAHAMRLDLFEFVIVGPGWATIVRELRRAGALVSYHAGGDDFEADYDAALDGLSRADYYLYLGLDEGAMGVLDALAAGVATIVTPQGYHLDLPHGITHSFVRFRELLAVFEQLAAVRRQRIDSVRGLTWHEYARQHATLWRAVLAGGRTDYLRLMHPDAASGLAPPTAAPWSLVRRWGAFYAREGAYYGRQILRRLTGI